MSGIRDRSTSATLIGAGFACAVLAGLALPRPACALTITPVNSLSNLNLGITDDGYHGTLGSMVSSSVTVGALAEPIISDVNVIISLDHTLAGDLTIKLQSPSGTIVTLVNRPGLQTADDGVQTGGAFANLSSGFSIVFDDSATADAEDMGQGLLDADIIGNTPGNGSPSVYVPDSEGANSDLLASFNGDNAVGVWTLYIGDSAVGETGTLQQWSLLLQTVAVPEPMTAALMACGGLMVLPRRRSGSDRERH